MTRRVSLLAVAGVLLASGIYALLYLFRWEWHRAIISAIFFLSAELALGIAVVLRRLTSLERRIEVLARDRAENGEMAIDPDVLEHIRAAAPPARRHFAWLDPAQSSGTSVFLPFLLGLGAVAAALAWVVEQIARRTATPVLEHRLARALAPVSLPAGGLVGPVPTPAAVRLRSRARIPLVVAAVFLAAAVTAVAVDEFAGSLQSRPEAHRDHVSTTVEIQMSGRRATAQPNRAATELWGTCSHVLHGRGQNARIDVRGVALVAVVIPSDVGRHDEARIRGCLEDAVVDRIQARVVSVDAQPMANR